VVVMQASLMAAPLDVAPTWGKELIAASAATPTATPYLRLNSRPRANSFAAPGDTAAIIATLLPMVAKTIDAAQTRHE
jgi:hypothetical protein